MDQIFDCVMKVKNKGRSTISFAIGTAIVFFLLLLSTRAEAPYDRPSPQKALHGVFRVNTTISAGAKSMDEIASKAEAAGLDFAVISDQFLVRCEYGLPPFRNVFRVTRQRKSVSTFGIERYLKLIRKMDAENPRLVLVPGVDIAPHYFWERDEEGRLVCRQFSQQLTLFGDLDARFLSSLPVIHNRPVRLDLSSDLARLLPLLLCILAVMALCRERPYYTDAQGNRYPNPKKLRNSLIRAAIFAIGLLWTLDNSPFRGKSSFDQYQNHGNAPYQAVIDYTRKTKASSVGIVWSAPEARSSFEIETVRFLTEKYPHVIADCRGHNGFAGIYADARNAHLPGREWDKALKLYCEGKIKTPPFAFGELDYHLDYDGIPFDRVKTVIFLPQNAAVSERSITKALVEGSCYAVRKEGSNEIFIDDFRVTQGEAEAFSGGAIQARTEGKPIVVKIIGRIISRNSAKAAATIRFIHDGREADSQRLDGGRFSLERAIVPPDGRRESYVRFIIESEGCGELLSNPIFIRGGKSVLSR